MAKHPNGLLIIAAIVAAASVSWLLTGNLLPYPLIRNGVYTSAALLGLYSISMVVSHWLDIRNFQLRSDRSVIDLKRRITIALFLLSGTGLLLRLWEIQEDRELMAAKIAYQSRDYDLAKKLFLQQRERYWTTDQMYKKISRAISASVVAREYEDLGREQMLFNPHSTEYGELYIAMKQLQTIMEESYPLNTEWKE